MKRVAVNAIIISTVLCIFALSCYSIACSEDITERERSSISLHTEQYFEGNLCYSPDATFFEESISGMIIPADMTGLPFIIENEYPHINKKRGQLLHAKLSGYLNTRPDSNGEPEIYLTIKSIKEISESKQRIQPMTGTYNGDGQTLTLSPNRTYTLREKDGTYKEGNWFLHSKNTMVLLSKNAKTVMKINYKKKSLNGREDHPTIFTHSSNLSSR